MNTIIALFAAPEVLAKYKCVRHHTTHPIGHADVSVLFVGRQTISTSRPFTAAELGFMFQQELLMAAYAVVLMEFRSETLEASRVLRQAPALTYSPVAAARELLSAYPPIYTGVVTRD